MKNNNSKNVSIGGMSLCSTLTVIFVVLKLLKVINWSWVWVLSPLWIGLIIDFILVLILVIVWKRTA